MRDEPAEGDAMKSGAVDDPGEPARARKTGHTRGDTRAREEDRETRRPKSLLMTTKLKKHASDASSSRRNLRFCEIRKSAGRFFIFFPQGL